MLIVHCVCVYVLQTYGASVSHSLGWVHAARSSSGSRRTAAINGSVLTRTLRVRSNPSDWTPVADFERIQPSQHNMVRAWARQDGISLSCRAHCRTAHQLDPETLSAIQRLPCPHRLPKQSSRPPTTATSMRSLGCWNEMLRHITSTGCALRVLHPPCAFSHTRPYACCAHHGSFSACEARSKPEHGKRECAESGSRSSAANSQEGNSPLHAAARKGHLDCLHALAHMTLDVDRPNEVRASQFGRLGTSFQLLNGE